MSRFDSDHPGRGTDAHTGDLVLDHAMAYALYASSAKLLGMDAAAEHACKWIEHNAKKASGAVGWGLPFEWDAFADGAPNPIDTVYGITTALSVKALVDCSPEGTVSKTAVEALDYYLRFSSKTEDGLFFWYSDQQDDAKSVFNVTSMLAAQYARVGVLLGRQDFLQAARAAASDLLANRHSGQNGYFWHYAAGESRPNDAVHASYVVQGAIELERWLGIDFDLKHCFKYLRKFFRSGVTFQYVKYHDLPPKTLKARARPWGVGMLLYTACESGDRHLRGLAEDAIEQIVIPGGGLKGSNLTHARHLAHLAVGLARASRDTKKRFAVQVADKSESLAPAAVGHMETMVQGPAEGMTVAIRDADERPRIEMKEAAGFQKPDEKTEAIGKPSIVAAFAEVPVLLAKKRKKPFKRLLKKLRFK